MNLICCVTSIGAAHDVMKAAKKFGITNGTITRGRGSVASHLLEVLGINEVRKEIVTMIVGDDLASAAMQGIGEEMEFGKPHHGIAFLVPVDEFFSKDGGLNQHVGEQDGEDCMYKIIYVIADKGSAEGIIEAANAGGARGGTIVNARSAGIHQVKLFSVEIEPQKEEVFIITKTDQKDGIINAIRQHLNLDQPGNGILYVLDIKEAYGLH